MSVAEISIFVRNFQGFDGIVVESLQLFQRCLNGFRKELFLFFELFVEFENTVNVTFVSQVIWNFNVLMEGKENYVRNNGFSAYTRSEHLQIRCLTI